MTPLGKVVVGSLLIILDFRIDGFDLVTDLVGWPVVLAGLLPLAARHGGFMAAAVAAGVGVLLAVPQQFAEPGPVIGALEAIVETAVVFGTCTGIIARVADPRLRRTANQIRWADLGITVAGTALSLAVGERVEVGGAAALPVVAMVLVALAVVVWFLIFAWTNRRLPELGPESRTPSGAEPSTP